MKTIIATIKPFKLEEVRRALGELGVSGFRAVECKGYGRHRGHSEVYRGAEYAVTFVPKIDVIFTIRDDQVDHVVQGILNTAKTGQLGDGRITVSPVEQFWNIRTGENEVTEEPVNKVLSERAEIS